MGEQLVSSAWVDGVAVVTIENPPVNALSHRVRRDLLAAIEQAVREEEVRAVVLACAGRTFSGGADLREFGRPPEPPRLFELIDRIEAVDKPVIAALFGTPFGGGFELALGCHYRVAAPSTRVGLPEVKLGLIPGAGGTQRLPRLIGPIASLAPIVTGEPVGAIHALEIGIIDRIVDEDPVPGAIAFAREIAAARPLPRISLSEERLAEVRTDPHDFDVEATRLLAATRGLKAPAACVESVRNALSMAFPEGAQREREIFYELREGPESKALRHLFFAEREALKIDVVDKAVRPKEVRRVAVIGAGTMGGGIAMSFAAAGFEVLLVEMDSEPLERGLTTVARNYQKTAARGGMTEEEAEAAVNRIDGTTEFARAAEADLVIEAVFEELALKKRLFADLDKVTRNGAILATNTSGLDVNEIAGVTSRPEDVVGMHFFSPANVMRLLEVVRGAATGSTTLKTVVDLGRRIGKVPVVVGVCPGFVGNRMLRSRTRQVERLLLEGATPSEVDAAARSFGFAMGPCAMADLVGLDVAWRVRREAGQPALVADAIYETGRRGQKNGSGYHRYEQGARTPIADPEIEALIRELSAREGIDRREISQEEIVERLVYPLINAGAQVLEEGIAQRPGDIDLIWIHGYGFPVAKGGPMYLADQIGPSTVADRLEALAEASGDPELRPVALLRRLAKEGRAFAELGAAA